VVPMNDVYSDLITEGNAVDDLVAGLAADEWRIPTPAPGWTIGHQVAHLAFIARLARLAASDAAAFETMTAPARSDFQGAVDAALAAYLADPPPELLARWREDRAAAAGALAAVPADGTVPWLVNPLPAGVLAAAGMMELFGHGQDIADALGVRREPADRLGHVVAFGTRTRDFGYLARGLVPPAVEFRFDLTAPSGTVWTFGPVDAAERISGPAYDFCLLITRRRHRDDLALVALGAEADRWLDLAQAYRGPAGVGRRPGQFAVSSH
jgi:enediyne biosynthesis protein E11